jgi:hypothetical protein
MFKSFKTFNRFAPFKPSYRAGSIRSTQTVHGGIYGLVRVRIFAVLAGHIIKADFLSRGKSSQTYLNFSDDEKNGKYCISRNEREGRQGDGPRPVIPSEQTV